MCKDHKDMKHIYLRRYTYICTKGVGENCKKKFNNKKTDIDALGRKDISITQI